MSGDEFFIQITSWLYSLETSLEVVVASVVGVLVAAGVLYTTFLAWRKYRGATNKV